MAEEITLASLARAAGKDYVRQEMQNTSDGTAPAFTAEERQQIDGIKQELYLTDSVTAVEFGIGCQRQR